MTSGCALWGGRSVFYFSFVETAVVSIVNTLDPSTPSYMEKALGGKKTAGQVKDDLKKSIARLPEGSPRSELEQLAIRFAAAKDRRNDLLHAMPASFGEDAHLVRLTSDKYVVWSTPELLKAAAEFEKLADDLAVAHWRTKPP
ncbi:hypothetical protein V1281_004311 [Nitrobacteraceae bacterium AZCC 2161]